MTATAIETTLHTPVDVRFVSGRPLAVRYDGRIWVVTGDPVRLTTGPREVQRSVQPGVEHWRVQVRLASNSVPQTFELRRDPGAGEWLLESITD